MQSIINRLLENPKIQTIAVINQLGKAAYAAIQYIDKYKNIYDILIDVTDLHFLVDGFSISSIDRCNNRCRYVYLKKHKKYLHQILMGTTDGFATHHTSENFTLDNRRSSLQVVPHNEHLLFHRRNKSTKSI